MLRVLQWRGRLFFRGGSPTEIEQMDYFSLRYWGEIAEIQAKAESYVAKNLNGG